MLIGGAALFTIGVAAERHATGHHADSTIEAAIPAAVSSDADGGEGTAQTETPVSETVGHSEISGETVLGVNLESNGLVVFAVVISMALAVLTGLRSRHSLLHATLVFALAFAVFDIAEVAHQIKESRGGLATLAGTIALVHLATTGVAGQRARAEPAEGPPTP